MRHAVVLALLSLFVCTYAANLYGNGAEEIVGEAEDLFAQHIATYNKVYLPGQRTAKFVNFKKSIARINEMNSKSPSAVFGLNKFSDMSSEEFRNTILMKNPIKTQPAHPKKIEKPVLNAPATFDWRDKKAVTAVKDQEQCGSCWAFSATEAVESAWILAGKANDTLALAPQQIVDCDGTSDGCNGGEPYSAYNYLVKAGGQEGEVSYKYKGEDEKCQFDAQKVVAKISGYKEATSWYSESELQTNLLGWGPLSVCVDAASWQDYKSGVMTHWQCAFINLLDHCVQLVGYDASNTTSPYWIVRNSWNTDWGVKGYIYLEMGHDTCGIAHQATWPTVA